MAHWSRPAATRATGWFVLGLLVLQGLWILVVPPFDGTDEMDHVYRALTVADGHVIAAQRPMRYDEGRGDVVSVRRDVVEAAHPACSTFRRYIGVNNCDPIADAGNGRVLIGSAAAAYNPVGYVAPALAGILTSGYHVVYAMRVASALLCTAVLAVAFWITARFARTRWPTLFLLTVLTPTTLFITTVTNPSGLHLACAVLLWLALLHLYGGDRHTRRSRHALLAAASLGAALLPATHTLGLGWSPVIIATALFSVGLRRSLRVIRQAPRDHLVAAAVAALSWLASLTWVLVAHTNDPGRVLGRAPGSPFPRVFLAAAIWPFQTIAAAPSSREAAPELVYTLWALSIGILLVAGLRHAGSRARRTSLVVLAVSLAVPLVLTTVTYPHLGLAWQGRYGFPYVCGAALIVASALDRRGVDIPDRVPWPLVVVGLAASQVVTMAALVAAKTGLAVWRDAPHLGYPSVPVLAVGGVVVALAWVLAVHGGPRPTAATAAPAALEPAGTVAR